MIEDTNLLDAAHLIAVKPWKTKFIFIAAIITVLHWIQVKPVFIKLDSYEIHQGIILSTFITESYIVLYCGFEKKQNTIISTQ